MAKGRRGRWIHDHLSDPYVQKAQQDGYRSRATYKLLELEEKHHFLRPGKIVLDLGAAPGGWSQVAAKKVGSKGAVLALDRLAMDPIDGVTILEVDFETEEGYAALRAALPEAGADVVLSDMAPNLSGIHAADQDRAIALAELALDLAAEVLAPPGVLVVKLFQGSGFDPWLAQARELFTRVTVRKPKASRPRSREVYAVAEGLRAGAGEGRCQ
jgi:23S rRNA (uridine2552-2'-O)-methyltransferase